MELSPTVSGIISGFISSALFAGIIGIWLDHKLAERAKQREASASVVDILAEWVRSAYTNKVDNEYLWRIQTTYWKNILLLDKELLDMLTRRLANVPDAPTADDIIIQARKILLNLPKPDICKEQLNHWWPKNDQEA